VFLVKLPASRKFIVPKNMRLLAVPLCQVHENLRVQTKKIKTFFAPQTWFWIIVGV